MDTPFYRQPMAKTSQTEIQPPVFVHINNLHTSLVKVPETALVLINDKTYHHQMTIKPDQHTCVQSKHSCSYFFSQAGVRKHLHFPDGVLVFFLVLKLTLTFSHLLQSYVLSTRKLLSRDHYPKCNSATGILSHQEVFIQLSIWSMVPGAVNHWLLCETLPVLLTLVTGHILDARHSSA